MCGLMILSNNGWQILVTNVVAEFLQKNNAEKRLQVIFKSVTKYTKY